MMLKISDADLKAVGAANAEEFSGKLVERLKAMEAFKAEVEASTKACEKLTGLVKDLEAKIAALPTATAGMTEEKVKELAKAEAGRVTTDALSKVGRPPVAAAAPDENAGDKLKALEEKGDWKALFEASKEIQAEFSSHEVFAAYKRAEARGAARIFERTASNQRN